MKFNVLSHSIGPLSVVAQLFREQMKPALEKAAHDFRASSASGADDCLSSPGNANGGGGGSMPRSETALTHFRMAGFLPKGPSQVCSRSTLAALHDSRETAIATLQMQTHSIRSRLGVQLN